MESRAVLPSVSFVESMAAPLVTAFAVAVVAETVIVVASQIVVAFGETAAAAVVSAVAASEKLLAEMYEGTLDYWSGCPQDLPVLAATSQTKQRKRSTV